MLLSVCELPVWAEYCVCSAPEIWILASFFQPALNLIFLTSLGTQQSSYTTLALYNLSLRDFPKSQNIVSAIQCAPHMQKRWSEKLGCAWSPVAWPTDRCHCVVVVLKINGCMLTRFDMLYKGSLWHSQTENTTSRPGKDGNMSESTTICHIVVTKKHVSSFGGCHGTRGKAVWKVEDGEALGNGWKS